MQNADHLPQLGQGPPAGRPQVFGGLAHLLCGRGHAQRTGLQHHQADVVGDHVVHLARQAGAFLGPGLLDPEPLLAFGAFGPFGERGVEAALGVGVQAEHGGGHHDEAADRQQRQHLGRRAGLPGVAEHQQGQRGRRHQQPPVAAVGTERVEREGRGQRHLDVAQRNQRQRDRAAPHRGLVRARRGA
nr:hypothetical protein [Spongiactinospora gelatinilytica]